MYKDLVFKKISKEQIAVNVFNMLYMLTYNELSQKEIAGYLGVSDRTIRNWMNGKMPGPNDYINLKRLCKKMEELRS